MKKNKIKLNKKNEIFFLTIKQKNDKIELIINCQNSFPGIYYTQEFSLNDLQKISKYFIIFETVDECFSDLKQKFDDNNYEMILNNINEKITIKIKTNIANKDFNLDIPVKKLEEEKIYNKFIYSNLKQNLNYYNDEDDFLSFNYFDKIDRYLDKKLMIFKNSINKIIDKDGNESEEGNENTHKIKDKRKTLFEKSTIIENNYERRLIESFIKEMDKSKIEINPILLFKSSVDGDSSKKFHEKCDFMGATITIVRTESGRRFGGYTSISWDKSKGNYDTNGINFLFSLDTRKLYKNTSGSNHTYHNESYGPTFGGGHDLYISSGCMSNQNSYSSKSSYELTSAYELNGGTQSFKVLDYEVYKI